MDDANQFLGGLPARVVVIGGGVDQVFADVVLDDLGDEAVHGAAAGCRLLEHERALLVVDARPFDRGDLSADAFEAIEKLCLLGAEMALYVVRSFETGGVRI